MYRKEIISYIVSIFLIFLACVLHYLDYYEIVKFPVNTIVFFLYSFVIFMWMHNMQSRVLRKTVVRRFKTIGVILICYLAVRTIKYEILIENEFAVSNIRYLYYIFPITLIHLVFLTSLFVGKSEREDISKYWNLLCIPTFILLAFILTNHLHGLAFSLDENARGFNKYGPFFYIGLFYIGILSLATLVYTMIPSFVNKQITQVIIPVSILLLWGLYTFLYMIDSEVFEYFKIIFKSAEFNILIVVLFIESLVFKRLLPSNRGYESFLKMSSLSIGIIDSNGKVIFSPKNYPDIDKNLIEKAIDNPIVLYENTLLESAKIKGGTSFWFVDLRDFNDLKQKLLDLNDDMLSENELLKANNKLRKNMAEVEEQREIREYIHLKLKPQFDKLKSILMNLPKDDEYFEKTLKYACILDVYIKRYSNLFLLTKNKNNLNLAELKLAFNESMDYLKLSDIDTKLEWDVNGDFDSTICLELYEIFQKILEFYFSYLHSISVSLSEKENKIQLKISMIPTSDFPEKFDLENFQNDSRLLITKDMNHKEIKWTISFERSAL